MRASLQLKKACYYACVKEMPGVHTQGETLKEARENLVDAVQLMIAYLLEKKAAEIDQSDGQARIEAELLG
jgi:predicted RNase H-like HicB family nuclease